MGTSLGLSDLGYLGSSHSQALSIVVVIALT